MKQPYTAAIAALVALSLAGCSAAGAAGLKESGEQAQDAALRQVVSEGETNEQADISREGGGEVEIDDKAAVQAVVEEFDRRLKDVSLLAPEEIVAESMQEHYGGLVAPELLERWKADPANAPGRLVSSPWPDRIEIVNMTREADDVYQVEGVIVEKTSGDLEDGFTAKRAITLVVTRTGDAWLITDAKLGDYVAPGPVTYLNSEYGFEFSLPEGWEGYTIVNEVWEGYPAGGSEPAETGPIILIRHPEWRAESPRQDIPIMVFTMDQWEAMEAGEFHIGAAPIGPSELGRNDEYVFALPARYNYAFPEGYEEVEEILAGSPLQPHKFVPAPKH